MPFSTFMSICTGIHACECMSGNNIHIYTHTKKMTKMFEVDYVGQQTISPS